MTSGPVIVVIQCGMKKLLHAAPARDLYIGHYFCSMRRAAEAIADRWYIASAKHGLIRPSKVIAPYDVVLPQGGDVEWGRRVREALVEFEPVRGRLIALCAARYLVGWAAELGAETPLAGVQGIGAQRRIAGELRREGKR